jgi:coiled-coil domain-containing protein 55
MNIDLSKASLVFGKSGSASTNNNKNRGQSLSMGLNTRGGGNVFQTGDNDDDDSSSSSHGDEPTLTGRKAVNQIIAREQAAIRERALTAIAPDSVDPQIYDYDGAYDSFAKQAQPITATEGSQKRQDGAGERKSRYIEDLMKNAEKRKIERDIIYERKVAREQETEEDLDPECRGKERFVTAAYKRKLEERKLWQQEEEKLRIQEENNDVTKQSDGVAAFYGNLNRNIAMGGGENSKTSQIKKDVDDKEHLRSDSALGFLQGFDRAEDDNEMKEENKHPDGMESKTLQPPTAPEKTSRTAAAQETNEDDREQRRKQMRLLREQKIDQARSRYFERQKRLLAAATHPA